MNAILHPPRGFELNIPSRMETHMPNLRSKKGVGDREYVRIPIDDIGITLFGDIKRRRDGQAVFNGIAHGLTNQNHQGLRRHLQLHGYSNKHGRIWLRDLIFRQMFISGDDSAPSAIQLLARTAYMGDFDPRSAPIERVTAELPTSHWLSDRTIKQRQFDRSTNSHIITAPIQVEPIKLFTDGHLALELNHFGSFDEHVNFRETISVEFQNGGTSEDADLAMDGLCLLVAVLTQARCWPMERTYWRFESTEHERARRFTWMEKQKPTPFTDWLMLPGAIVEAVQRMLPDWIKAIKDPQVGTLIRHFVTATNKNGYIEEKFLALCQCFEGLNKARLDNEPASSRCDIGVLKEINEKAKSLGLNSDFRRKIKKSFEDAAKMTLEDRLRKVFNASPLCIQQVMEKHPRILEEVAKRRNQLSHGSTDGAIKTQEEFNRLLTETAVIRVHCLAEILFLGGISAEAAESIVCLDLDAKYTHIH